MVTWTLSIQGMLFGKPCRALVSWTSNSATLFQIQAASSFLITMIMILMNWIFQHEYKKYHNRLQKFTEEI